MLEGKGSMKENVLFHMGREERFLALLASSLHRHISISDVNSNN